MHSMNSIIPAHNRSILNPLKTNYGCNCRDNTNCCLQNHCITPSITYEADVSNNVDNKKRVYYLGISETRFKERCSNHVRDSKHERYSNAIELLKYIWEIK